MIAFVCNNCKWQCSYAVLQSTTFICNIANDNFCQHHLCFMHHSYSPFLYALAFLLNTSHHNQRSQLVLYFLTFFMQCLQLNYWNVSQLTFVMHYCKWYFIIAHFLGSFVKYNFWIRNIVIYKTWHERRPKIQKIKCLVQKLTKWQRIEKLWQKTKL